MRIMGKKIIIIALLLTSATFAFGQISSNGQLQQFIAHGSYLGLIDCKGIVYDGGIYLPIVKAKTKSVVANYNTVFYTSKEEVYNTVLHQLRLDKLSINKQIIDLQKELYAVE